jgi:hypothetical protein
MNEYTMYIILCTLSTVSCAGKVHHLQSRGRRIPGVKFLDEIQESSRSFPPCRREIIYCKRAILSLSSSRIFDHPSPSQPGECVPPAFVGGEDTPARRRGGWGVNILEDERDRIALLQ